MIPEGKYIDVQDDFRFHYYDEGEGDVVLLLHGSGTGASGHTNFKNNFIALRNAGFRVILYNEMPGIKKLMSDLLGGDMNQDKIEGLLALFPYDASIVTEEMIQERMEILPLMNSQVLATMAIPNMEDDLHKLTQPILAFWGVNDQFIPVSGSMKIAQNCPNAQIMLFSQCGHWVMIEKEEIFNNACINFLSS